METSDVRRRVREAVAAARRDASERRTRIDAASRAWTAALEGTIVPLSRQVVQALAAEGVRLQVSTPGESVIIGSEHRPDEHVELSLEAAGEEPQVVARVNRPRASVSDERVVAQGAGAIEALDDARIVEILVDVLRPWMAR